jgi:hypothetical protein
MKLTTIGWIYIVFGLLALLHVIWDLFQGKLVLNLAIFMIPVGFGLIGKKESSFRWAIAWSWIIILITSIVLITAIFSRIQVSDKVLVSLISIPWLCLFVYVNRRLSFISSQTGIYVFGKRRNA